MHSKLIMGMLENVRSRIILNKVEDALKKEIEISVSFTTNRIQRLNTFDKNIISPVAQGFPTALAVTIPSKQPIN